MPLLPKVTLLQCQQKRTLVCYDWKVQVKRTLSECNLDLVKPMYCMYSCYPVSPLNDWSVKGRYWPLYSLPDSIGDDLIVEVLDSKGKQYGRVLAQVAAITEDPVMLSKSSLACQSYPVMKGVLVHFLNFMITAGWQATMVVYLSRTRAWACWKTTTVH